MKFFKFNKMVFTFLFCASTKLLVSFVKVRCIELNEFRYDVQKFLSLTIYNLKFSFVYQKWPKEMLPRTARTKRG